MSAKLSATEKTTSSRNVNSVIYNDDTNPPFILTKKSAWLLWSCQLFNVASLTVEISVWMLGIISLCLCWQALLLTQRTKQSEASQINKPIYISPVSSLILRLFAISGCIAIAISAKNLGVLLSMIHLLSFAYVLKSFELKHRKDFYQHSLLGVFLLASALIFQQGLFFSSFIFLLLVINLSSLSSVFAPKESLKTLGKTTAILVFQSIFLAIVLFLVFPRLSPFWQVPIAKSAKTGLSDNISPGDIANLALSSELAFRVDFKGQRIPNYSQLYWRAMTLEDYDGRKWSRSSVNTKQTDDEQALAFSPDTSGEGINYQVMAEASYQPWLFALAVATSEDSQILLQRDYTLVNSSPLSHTKHYAVTSYLAAPLALSLSSQSRNRNLAFKKESNPKLAQLAAKLKQSHVQPIEIAQAALSIFNEEQFFYTLQPPLLMDNSLDQFFFDTKAGFCVHYASSFTYLMRAAGIPARVVTGYLGGEYNDTNEEGGLPSGHLNVYQYDAHAWSEIWIEGIGWHRVDPTAAVDPQRVNQGWSTRLLEQQSLLNNDFISLYRIKQLPWLNALRLQLDALDYQWTRWVIGYSTKQQVDLLKRWFGQHMPWKTGAIIAITLISVMGTFALWYKVRTPKKKQNVPHAHRLYQQCLLVLAKQGITKAPASTIKEFCLEVEKEIPAISLKLKQLTVTFEQLTYQKIDEKTQQVLLKKMTEQVDDFLRNSKHIANRSS